MGTTRRSIRVDDDRWEAWADAASERGLSVSELVRAAVDDEVGGGVEIENDPPLESLTGVPGPPSTDCPHPKGSRRSLGYATVCDDCGEKIR